MAVLAVLPGAGVAAVGRAVLPAAEMARMAVQLVAQVAAPAAAAAATADTPADTPAPMVAAGAGRVMSEAAAAVGRLPLYLTFYPAGRAVAVAATAAAVRHAVMVPRSAAVVAAALFWAQAATAATERFRFNIRRRRQVAPIGSQF